MKRLALQRAHTGTLAGEQLQQQGRDAGRRMNLNESTLERMLRGLKSISMNNADYRASKAESVYSQFELLGTHTSPRAFILPDETDDAARIVWVTNKTGQNVLVTTATGSVTVANTATKAVRLRASGPELVT